MHDSLMHNTAHNTCTKPALLIPRFQIWKIACGGCVVDSSHSTWLYMIMMHLISENCGYFHGHTLAVQACAECQKFLDHTDDFQIFIIELHSRFSVKLESPLWGLMNFKPTRIYGPVCCKIPTWMLFLESIQTSKERTNPALQWLSIQNSVVV